MRNARIYRILGVLLLLIGIISLMNTVVGLAIHHQLLWRSGLFLIMDFSIAWGFFARQSWLSPLLGVNAAGQLVLFGLQYAAVKDISLLLFPLFGLCLAIILFAFVYRTRRLLRSSTGNYIVAAGFLIPWAVIFYHTASALLK